MVNQFTKDIDKWAGPKAHQLWLDDSSKALADPNILEQLRELGYPQDNEGYAKMMHHIGKGLVQLDPKDGKISLTNMDYLKSTPAAPVEIVASKAVSETTAALTEKTHMHVATAELIPSEKIDLLEKAGVSDADIKALTPEDIKNLTPKQIENIVKERAAVKSFLGDSYGLGYEAGIAGLKNVHFEYSLDGAVKDLLSSKNFDSVDPKKLAEKLFAFDWKNGISLDETAKKIMNEKANDIYLKINVLEILNKHGFAHSQEAGFLKENIKQIIKETKFFSGKVDIFKPDLIKILK